MIIRLVQLTFREDETENFLSVFSRYRDQIRAAKGCSHLELWRDIRDPRIFFTCSHWDEESSLNEYRKSEIFMEVWPQTKDMFAAPPRVWTVKRESIQT